jgi:hypothetical protein
MYLSNVSIASSTNNNNNNNNNKSLDDLFNTVDLNNNNENIVKDHDDMTNFYASSGSIEDKNPKGKSELKDNSYGNFKLEISSNTDDDDSDWDSDESDTQKKIYVKINPIVCNNNNNTNSNNNARSSVVNSPEVLNQVSKSLKLNFLHGFSKTKSKSNVTSKANNDSDLSNNETTVNEIVSTTTTTQTITVSLIEPDSRQTPPPLPPLPLDLQQKAKEKQRQFQEEFSLKKSSVSEKQQKSEPILIKTNGIETVKAINKNVEISYDSSSSSSSAKMLSFVKRTASTVSSDNHQASFNIQISSPKEREVMQF